MVHEHIGAGPRRHDHGRVTAGEDVDRVACHFLGVGVASCIERWLAAARLSLGHEYLETRTREDVGDRNADVWVEVIDEAGHQQLHGPRPRRVRSSHEESLYPERFRRQDGPAWRVPGYVPVTIAARA
jgi:hypothetical protein